MPTLLNSFRSEKRKQGFIEAHACLALVLPPITAVVRSLLSPQRKGRDFYQSHVQQQKQCLSSSQHILVTTDKLLVYDSATPGSKDHRNLFDITVDERERYREIQMNTNSTFSNFCTADRWVRQTPSFNSTLPGGDNASTAERVHKGKAGSQFAFASCCSSSLAFPPQP